ncbi:transcription termination/antitermination NusG family protein [Pseudomonas chlororaphis]|uniref:transcription termination/antitermination NusG family protein n=1 Tax=Pseudomonas chlororaphis TaxID=587753 RepID=UPI002D76C90C|nr:transcription termination/antitermination NusG family protein [Pseudomonas chlororaphis]
MQSWYLITHNLHSFQTVASKLGALGVEIYSPTKIEVQPRKDCKGTRVVEKQLFPGYLFLRFDHEVVHTTAVSDVQGVKGFVRFGNNICTVSDSLIEAMKQSTHAERKGMWLLKAYKSVRSVECRHISADMVELLQSISKLKSPLERQVALYALMEKDAQLIKLLSRPRSQVAVDIKKALAR